MYERTFKIFDQEKFNDIIHKAILLVGVGGVGGYALESLIRFGFQNITIVDHDTISISNLNRQILANTNNIGQSKVEEARKRALNINKNVNLNILPIFLTKDNINQLSTHYDYIIDACDTISTKLALIQFAIQNDIKIISCLGTGNRLDPTQLVITDIWQTSYDPVAKILRKLLRDNNITNKITVIWSKEKPIKINDSQPGSICTVPAVAGIYMASHIINEYYNAKEKS